MGSAMLMPAKSLIAIITKTVRPKNGTVGINGLINSHAFLLLRVQELCESGGGRPGLPVLTSLTVSVEVKQH